MFWWFQPWLWWWEVTLACCAPMTDTEAERKKEEFLVRELREDLELFGVEGLTRRDV